MTTGIDTFNIISKKFPGIPWNIITIVLHSSITVRHADWGTGYLLGLLILLDIYVVPELPLFLVHNKNISLTIFLHKAPLISSLGGHPEQRYQRAIGTWLCESLFALCTVTSNPMTPAGTTSSPWACGSQHCLLLPGPGWFRGGQGCSLANVLMGEAPSGAGG